MGVGELMTGGALVRKLEDPARSPAVRGKKMATARRSFAAPVSWDEEARSYETVVRGTEPLEWFDWERGEFVGEVHLASGMRVRGGRDSVVLLDSHDTRSLDAVLGRVYPRAENGVVMGRVEFATGERAERAAGMVKDGTLTDVSMGAVVKKWTYLEAGETKAFDGRVLEGPLNVVTEWELHEVSLVPIGYDAEARAASWPVARPIEDAGVGDGAGVNDGAVSDGVRTMKFKLKDGRELSLAEIDALRRAGQEVVLEDGTRLCSLKEVTVPAPEGDGEKTRPAAKPADVVDVEKIRREAGDAAADAEHDRLEDLNEMARACGIEKEELDKAKADRKFDLKAARKAWLPKLEERNGAHPSKVRTEVGEDRGTEAFRAAAADALLVRSGLIQLKADGKAVHRSRVLNQETGQFTSVEQPVQVHEAVREFGNMGLQDVVRYAAHRAGVSPFGKDMTSLMDEMRRRRFSGGMTTSDLDAVFENTLNKSLGVGFLAAPGTWREWCRTTSINDLRENHIVKRSRHESLARIDGERAEVPHGSISDKKETYYGHLYSRRFSITDQMIINDDLDALTNIPADMAAAAEYTVNELVYYLLMSNPTMNEDTTALFHADHSNLGTAGDPSDTTFTEMIKLMASQTGLNGKPIPANMPASVIVPPAQYVPAKVMLESMYKVGGGNQETNVFYRMANVVMEPLLASGITIERTSGADLTAAAAAHAWYAATAPSAMDTILVGFLNGQQTPRLEMDSPLDALRREYRVTLGVGAGLGDFRGLFKNPDAS